MKVAVGPAVGQPVDQRGISVEAKNDVLVCREERVSVSAGWDGCIGEHRGNFMTAPSPGIIATTMRNAYYDSTKPIYSRSRGSFIMSSVPLSRAGSFCRDDRAPKRQPVSAAAFLI